jgi:methylated-DNA-[protein]-cysteine S-methyltransferase
MIHLPTISSHFYAYYHSPIGIIEVQASENSLVALSFVEKEGEQKLNQLLEEVIKQLTFYFQGKLKLFDIPLNIQGSTFQIRVYNEVLSIPYGELLTYSQLARRLGNDKCIRAASHVNAINPLLILVPCHRVIGKYGTLTGYAGELWRKQWLLEHEGKYSGRNPMI